MPGIPKYKSPSLNISPFSNAFWYLWVPVVFGVSYYLFPGALNLKGDPTIPISSAEKFDPLKITADLSRRDAVVRAFKHAWDAYERDAFGDDEYHPVSQKGSNLTASGGIGYMIVDSIDTMMLMGLTDEYERAREWIATNLSFEREGARSTFETTIRVLGGLLSAHYLSPSHSSDGEPDLIFLEKATDLGGRLLSAFQTESGLPLSMVDLAERKAVADPDNRGFCSTSEVSTVQLELRYLTWLTDDDQYWHTGEKVMQVLRKALKSPLAPVFISPVNGQFLASDIRLGSRGDSFYEYLLKQYLQTSRVEPGFREMYDAAMETVSTNLVRATPSGRLVFTVEYHPTREGGRPDEVGWRMEPKQDHLVCFLGGLLMLGATDGAINLDRRHFSAAETRDWKLGEELIKTCMETHVTRTGLAPEIAMFRTNEDPDWIKSQAPSEWYIKGLRGAEEVLDARYILRPETIESLFFAYRLTGDQKYRQWGWKVFQAIEKHCKVPTGGYSGVKNVDVPPSEVQWDDRMETFMMSETLKYLYLLFSEGSILPLSDVVFNTEAHPLPLFRPEFRTGFS